MYIDLPMFLICLVALAAAIFAMRFMQRRNERQETGDGILVAYAVSALVAVVAAIGVWLSTSLGGNHRPIDEPTIRGLGEKAFNEDYYRGGAEHHGAGDGLEETWRYINPDYASATVRIEDKHSGEYCIHVTQESSAGYAQTRRLERCIQVDWDPTQRQFKAFRLSDLY